MINSAIKATPITAKRKDLLIAVFSQTIRVLIVVLKLSTKNKYLGNSDKKLIVRLLVSKSFYSSILLKNVLEIPILFSIEIENIILNEENVNK